jgi:hypothetical protein
MTDIDFYGQCETGFVTRLRTLTQFFKHDWQISDDDTVIAKGEDHFVVYRPGEFPSAPAARGSGLYDIDWHITADLYVRYKEYKTSWTKFKALRSAIIPLIFRDQTLGNTPNVWRTSVNSQEKAQYFRFSDAPSNIRANFIIQTLDVIITQRVQFEQ